MAYDPKSTWRGNSYFGASLKSLELLGQNMGYNLVGCNFSGVNAFFVRSDLTGDEFFEPYSSIVHYEPARYHLISRTGHPRSFGEFEAC